MQRDDRIEAKREKWSVETKQLVPYRSTIFNDELDFDRRFFLGLMGILPDGYEDRC